MQSLAWYRQRLLTMSLPEILWRLLSAVRNFVDRYRYRFQIYPSQADVRQGVGPVNKYGFEICSASDAAGRPAISADWRQSLVRQADRIAAHRLSFLDLDDVFLGDPIDWNREHAHGQKAPMAYAPSIDYRDFRLTGDCKLVWEPNRHHHLVVLGRAYRGLGDRRYAAEAVAQMQSWMDQCPFGKGMNWRSPLELGIRLINWVWTIALIQASGVISEEFHSRMLHAVYFHVWEITRKYSRGSSANNHLIGEAAGVFVACSFFNRMPNAQKWMEESRRLLCREITTQTYDDGCTREQALGYHFFVLQLFLIAGLVGRYTSRDFPEAYWQRLEKMFAFAAAMLEGGENAPMFGDCDDGYVLDLGGGAKGFRAWLGVAAIVFNRSDFKALCEEYSEPAFWLLGAESRRTFDRIPSASRTSLQSRQFLDSGYCLLQCGGCGGSGPAVSVLTDSGELGYTSIAAHGHADALSFILRVNGTDVLVDPGTYDYFSFPAWRSYFRSTRAHNTVVVDNEDQSVMLGPFMWGHRADSRCITWDPYPGGGGRVVVEHDGYRRLRDPVIHRRIIELNAQTGALTIQDDLTAAGDHSLAILFHCSEWCVLQRRDLHSLMIGLPGEALLMELDSRLDLTILSGSDEPIGGWVSRGYHRKTASATIAAEGRIHGSASFVTTIRILDTAQRLDLANGGH